MLRFRSAVAVTALASVVTAHAAQGPLPDMGSGITRDIGSIAVIEHDGSAYDRKLSDGTLNYAARIAVAKRFYETHGDFYDFLIIFTNFEFDTGDATAFHSLVSNSVVGIGKPLAQGAREFGSLGRLKGVVDMAALSRYQDPNGPLSPRPGDSRFLVALNTLAHEMGHQWLAEAQYRDGAGNASTDLLGRDGSHWSYLLDSDASIMYGSDWVETLPGHFKAERVRAGYSPLDLYLMGFLNPNQVPPFSLLRAPGVDPTALPVEGAELDAAAETITIDQVVSAMGPRSPDSENSQKEFRLGFVFLTAPGTEPSAEDLEAVETIRQYFGAHFFALTRGIGLADTSLTDSPAAPTAATPDLDLAKSWLLGRQQVDGRFEDSGSTSIRDTAAAAKALGSLDTEPLAAGRALGWLDTVAPANADFKARQVSSIAPSASAARRQILGGELLSYASESGGFGLFPGFAADSMDTALVLQALRLNQTLAGPVVDSAFGALADTRLPGGGWPTVRSAQASVAATAEVLLAIQAWQDLGRGTALKADALAGLLALQNADGGFGENGASTAYASATALAALTEAGAPSTVAQPVIAWLQSHQAQDGSWNESVYETARVLSALRGGTKPNLVVPVASLTVEPKAPEEGDVVLLTAVVKNVGRTTAGPTHAAFYDGAPGTSAPISVIDIPEIGPDGDFVAQFTLDTADRPGHRDLYVVADSDKTLDEVREDDNAGSVALTVKGLQADLEVRPAGVEVTPLPLVIGDVAQIRVTVSNQGQRTAPASILLVTDGDPRAGGVPIGQVFVPSLAPGGLVVVEIGWNVQGAVGPREIHATADADLAIAESEEGNNEAAFPVEIASQVPDQADLVIESARFEPEVLQRVPSVVQYHALVANVGRAAAVATVRLFDAAAPAIPLAEQTVTLAGRSRLALTFDVPVAGPGSRVVIARADPDDAVIEADETNNDASALLTDSHATVDLVLTSASVTPSSVVVGHDALLSIGLRNEGTANALSVPVILFSSTGGELARVNVTASAATSLVVEIPWKATLIGEPLNLSVRVDPFNTLAELDEDNNQATVELTVTAAPETNLTVQSSSIAFDPNPLKAGLSAQISATVLNTSPVSAGPFAVRFYLGDPQTTGQVIGEQLLAGLGAGSSVMANVTWSSVAGGGATGIFVVVDADDSVVEYDETDNWTFRPFVALGYPDLALSTSTVTPEPRFPRSGQLVRVSAQVSNVGGQPAAASLLTVTEGEGDAAVMIASVPLPPLAVNERQTVDIDWTPSGAGERLLTLSADAGNVLVEADEGNNAARLSVLVQDADIYLTEVFFSPDGDGNRDATTLAYRAGSPVSIGVFDPDGRRLRTLADSAPPEGTVTWDGRGDTGIIVPDGTYLLSVREENGAVVGTASTVVDTNREDLHAAAGTPMLAQRNVSCSMPDWLFGRLQGPVWTRAEDGLLFIQPAPEEDSEFSARPGLIRVGLDGSYEYLFQGEDYVGWTFASEVSPDGREVAIKTNGALEILDLITGARRPIGANWWEALKWSPDGQKLSNPHGVMNRLGEPLFDLPTPEATLYGDPRDWAWSPDGRFLANGNTIINSDGTGLRTLFELPTASNGQESYIGGTDFRGDGKIVVTTCFDAGEGCGRDRTLVVDPATNEVTELTWLARRPDSLSETTPHPLKWSRAGGEVLYSRRPSAFAPTASYVADQNGQSERPMAGTELFAPSPQGTGALFWQYVPSGACAGRNAQFVLTTLNNLTVNLEATRLPGNRGVALRATAADRNLAFFQLDYAEVAGNPTDLQWRPIGPAHDAPVLDELLTIWVPPSPGMYAVRLRAEDKAGNVRVRTQVLSWDRSPVIANLTQSMRLISPTGDGIRDDVTFSYLVLEPSVVEVRINGPKATGGAVGPLVKAFALQHPSTGPASFIWDGRDELGVLVPDGVFTVSIADLPFSVKVDTTPPDIAWTYGPLQYANGELSTTVSRHVVDANLKDWSLGTTFTSPVFVPALSGDGSPVFGPQGAPVAAIGPDGRALDEASLEKVIEVHTRVGAVLTATDQAGNTSSLTVAPVPRGLFLLSACEADPDLEEGKCRLERTYPNNQGSVRLPLKTFFRLVETSGERGAPVHFEHRLRGTTTWSRGAALFNLRGRDVRPHRETFPEDVEQTFGVVDFEALGLEPGAQYEGRFVREGNADALSTDIFAFSPCNPYVETMVEKRVTGVLDPENTIYDVSIAGGVGEGVRQGRLNVTGDGKTLAAQAFDVRSGAEIRIPNEVSVCALAFSVELVGDSGKVYSHLAPCQRLVKVLRFPCPTPGGAALTQVFSYCAAGPDEVRLQAELSSGQAAFEAGSPVGEPISPQWSPSARAYIWDVAGRPEGTAVVRAGSRGSDGSLLNAISVDAVIDRTPPGVFVLDPAIDGALVCPAAPLPDGRRAATFAFEADDLGGAVEVCSASFTPLTGPLTGMSRPIVPLCSGPGGSPVECGSLGAPEHLRVATNTPASLTSSIEGLARGEYALSLTLADRSGNRTQSTRQFTIQGAAIGVGSPSPLLFSPNGDGLVDQTTIRISVAQAATVSVQVESVKEILAGVSVAPGSSFDVVWDGRRADGSVVPDGKYSVLVESKDACGTVSTKRVVVEVDNTPPAVALTSPIDGASVSVSATVRGHAADLNFSTYQLLSRPVSGGEFTALGPAVARQVNSGTAGLLGNWAVPTAPGAYLLRLTALDRAQNRSETTISLNVGLPDALRGLGVAPDLFSPNDDGRRESATIGYSLAAARRVTLHVLRSASGAVVRSLQSSQDVPLGDYVVAWDGRDDDGGVVPDGEYSIRLATTDPDAVAPDEVREVSVLVDGTPPTIEVTEPLTAAVVARESEVRGSIEDPLLKEFSLNALAAQGGSSAELGRGSTPVTRGSLAKLSQLSDGGYSLFVFAEDAAENRSIKELPFVVDTTPPEVLFADPAPGAVLPIGATPISVTGTASDTNLSLYSLSFGRGATPSYFISVKTGVGSIHDTELAAWMVSALPDDTYTLKLTAQDRAGLQAEARRTVILDGTPPLALLTAPVSGSRTNGTVPLVGTASDANFERWTLEGSPGVPGPGSQWTELVSGDEPVIGGVLWDWDFLPSDGVHSFRLSVHDRAGHLSQAITTLELDTVPPPPPVLVRVDIENRQPATADLRVVWLPSPATDIMAYRLRHEGENDSIELGRTQLSYLDAGRSEGAHKYYLSAVDSAGNESDEGSIDRLLDLSPPTVAMAAPAAGAFVSGEVQVRGIAFSAQDFKEYRLYAEPEGNPAARVLVRKSNLPVSNGLLGTWFALGNGNYLLTLQAEDFSGNQAETTSMVVVDNLPPEAVTLTSLQAAPDATSLTANWTASTSTDAQGYLLYRNGRLANTDALVLGDLLPYAIPGLSYRDGSGLPDGHHCYTVVVIDAASNRSAPSNELCADLDNRPPHAVISSPEAGHRFDAPLLVAATSPDTDIASVTLQYRATGTSTWLALGPPDSSLPYEGTLATAGLTEGEYDLRAVATDAGGQVDPSPELITVRFTDVTAPAAPLNLAREVDGDRIRLTWSAAPSAVKYTVYRDGVSITPVPVSDLTLDDPGRPVGQYAYAVTASDDHDNESPRSNAAIAVVYAPVLSGPSYPVLAEAASDLLVEDVRAEGTLEVYRNDLPQSNVPALQGTVMVSAAPLEVGANVFKVRVLHANGDRSLWSEDVVLIRNQPPPQVLNLQGSAAGTSAALQWDPVVDPELVGYEVSRDGATLSTSELLTSAEEIDGTPGLNDPYYRISNHPIYAFDQNPGTVWIPPADALEPFLTLTLPGPQMVRRISLQFAAIDVESFQLVPGAPEDYRVDLRWEGRYLPVLTVHGNQAQGVEHDLPAPFLTDGIRIVLLGPGRDRPTGLSEVGLTAVRYLAPDHNSLQDPGLSDGHYHYSVAAVDRYGAVGLPAVAEVPIGDVQPPASPLNLTAKVLAGDVRLDWIGADPGDTDHFVLLRDGVEIAQTPGALTTHLDVAPLNGPHEYRVYAVDAVGNRSADSNQAFVTLAEPVLPPPVLSGSGGPLGESALSWAHPGASHFDLLRSLDAAGPFTVLTRTNDMEYRDFSVPFGATAWYLVRAIDGRLNPSPDSNVVAVTPARTEPPSAPVILEPTDSANPIHLDLSSSPVGGRTEKGTGVRVYVDGTLSAITQEETRFVPSDPPDLPADAFGVQISASGSAALYTSDVAGEWVLFWRDLVSGRTVMVPKGTYNQILSASLSPDGNRVALSLYGPASGFEGDLWVFDALTDGLTSIEEGAAAALNPSWSGDSRRLAYGLRSSSFPYAISFEVKDLPTGAVDVAAGYVPYDRVYDVALSLSPDGRRLVYGVPDQSGVPILRIVDLETRSDTVVGLGYEPAWNPGGTDLAFTKPAPDSDPEGLPSVVVRTIATGAERFLSHAEGARFDPAGQSLLFRTDEGLVVEETATGRRQTLGPWTFEYGWIGEDRVAFRDYSTNSLVLNLRENGYFTASAVSLHAGENIVTARAIEPISGLESEDSLPISITLDSDGLPDLVVDPQGRLIYPAAPRTDQASMASALVRNEGPADITDVVVSLEVRDSSGQATAEQRLSIPYIGSGASVRVLLPFTAPTQGTYLFKAIVDPDRAIVESSEDNNEQAWEFDVVVAASPLTLSVTPGSPSYGENSHALVTVQLKNGGLAASGVLTTRIESASDGLTVTALDSRSVSLAFGGQLALPLIWDVGQTYAGTYRARSTLRDAAGGMLAEATAPIEILPSRSALARLVAERYSTGLGGSLPFAATVANTSHNAPLVGAQARFTLTSATGVIVLQTDVPLPPLLPGAVWPHPFVWNPAMPVGGFEARLEVIHQGTTLSSSATEVAIVPAGPVLGGRIILAAGQVLELQGALAEATLTNPGPEPRPATPARVEVREAATGQIVESIPFTIDLPAAGSAFWSTTLAGRPAGRYLVTLVDAGTGLVVDRANLRVHAAIAPPSLHTPALGSRVATPHPDLSVNNASVSDGAPLTYEFQLFADSALTVSLPGGRDLAEGTAQTSWHVPSRLVEDHTYYWRARASDGFSTSAWTSIASFMVDEINESPFAPVPESPEPGKRAATRQPSLVVRNAIDPEDDALTYEFQLATDPDALSVVAAANSVSETAVLTAWMSPLTLTENATYYWRARAFDGASYSPWSETVSFLVDSSNESPGAPTIVAPAPGATVASLSPLLVAGPASDPEGDPLHYRFEIDSSPAFDSPALQTVSDLTPGSLSVAWTPPVGLQDDTTYFWRVAANDGNTQGPWALASFRVNLANDPPTAPVLLAPADGEIVASNQPTLRVRNATDPDGDALTYEFLVTDATLAVVAAMTDVPSGQLETGVLVSVPLAENGVFTWKARARDAELAGPWSDPSSFRVNGVQDPPTAPNPFSPKGGVQIDVLRPTLVLDNAISPDGRPLSYNFELFREEAGGATLVTSAAGVAEAQPRTEWPVDQELTDGSYSWRARASDGLLDGPWSASALFSVLVDAPPSAPTGLVAVGGDGRITLGWNRNPEADVLGYRLYRGPSAGGPYVLVATVVDPGVVDVPLPNGVAQYYVLTAFDSRFESLYSAEASATPRGSSELAAQISASPNQVAATCLVNGTGSSRHESDDQAGEAGKAKKHGDDDDDDDQEDDQDEGGGCPTWIKFRIELPAGISPATINRASVRVAGSVPVEASYDRIVDSDHDGIPEREFRVRLSSLAPFLQVGLSVLNVSGTSSGTPFLGEVTITVLPLFVEMKFVPRTLSKKSKGQVVQAELQFEDGISAAEVLFTSIRLNGSVLAERVVSSRDEKITYKFDRAAVANLLPLGSSVEVSVSGTIRGIPFAARDIIRVIQ